MVSLISDARGPYAIKVIQNFGALCEREMDFLLTSIISVVIFRPDYSIQQIACYLPAALTRRWRRKPRLSQYYSSRMVF